MTSDAPSADAPSANDPSANDPSANDPSANDPSAGEPSAGEPFSTVLATAELPVGDLRRDPLPLRGRIVFMTSGQDLGPLPGEVAYAASNGALSSVTATLADQLADRAITVNTVNPGPVDTGYAPPAAHEAVRRHFPQGRWGVPDDPARLIAWLVTEEAAWITGQVINTEGGLRRWN